MKKQDLLKLDPKDFYQKGLQALEAKKITKQQLGKLMGEYLTERRKK